MRGNVAVHSVVGSLGSLVAEANSDDVVGTAEAEDTVQAANTVRIVNTVRVVDTVRAADSA